MNYYLETDQLTKVYKGRTVLDNVSIHVKKGDIYALSGQMGAGKTTLFKIISQLALPTSGEVRFAEDIRESGLGVLIEAPGFFPNLTAYQNLAMRKRALDAGEKQDLRELLSFTGLSSWADVKVRSFSGAMLKRLSVSMALVNDPSLLLLDELLTALDQQTFHDFGIILRALKERGKTVIISGSRPEEMAKYADVFGFLENGLLREEKTAEEIRQSLLSHIRITAEPMDKVKEVLEEMGIFSYRVQNDSTLLLMERFGDIDEILAKLRENEVQVQSAYPIYDAAETYFGVSSARR